MHHTRYRAAVLWAVALLVSIPGTVQGQEAAVTVLDVPYVSQSEALCGGAAAAMVLRYWGKQGIYAEDFAPYVVPAAGGIPADALVAALDSLGWQTYPFRGTASEVQAHLDRGRPVIGLIEVAPERYHYVVFVAWTPEGVLLHDPAVAPYRVVTTAALDRAWAATDWWALLVLPPAVDPAPADMPAPSEKPADVPCAGLIEQAVQHAAREALGEAEAALQAARSLCPTSAAVLRELAGLRFREGRPGEAAALAEEALVHDPDDAYTWRLLASSRFLMGDADGALQDWNQVDEPRLDLVQVQGLRRTRHHVATDLMHLAPGDLLTPAMLMHARRRLELLPSARTTSLRYEPLPSRQAQVVAVVDERALFLGGWQDAAALLIQTLPRRTLGAHLNSPTGGGERLRADWRWQAGRPRVRVRLAAPVGSLPGIVHMEGRWERQTYALPPGTSIAEERRHLAIGMTDWVTAQLQAEVGLLLDRWDTRGTHAGLEGALAFWPFDPHLVVRIHGRGWMPLNGSTRFGAAVLEASWVSRLQREGWVAEIRAGLDATTAAAPLALWAGAGTGSGRPPLLRAHPLLDSGILTGEVFGRLLAHGGAEVRYWRWPLGPGRLGLAGFVDAARAWETLAPENFVHVDAGFGLRLALPGEDTILRADAALGLRDGATALSAGWLRRLR